MIKDHKNVIDMKKEHRHGYKDSSHDSINIAASSSSP